MPSLNKVFLMGNLTRDPEVRHTPKGTAVGDLGLAINMSYRSADGTVKDEVCYVDVVVWGRQAETCKDYLAKGRSVFVEGRLQLDQWESQGEKKSRLRVRAERVQFLSDSRGGGSGGGGSGQRSDRDAARGNYSGGNAASSQRPPLDEPPPDFTDDEVPF